MNEQAQQVPAPTTNVTPMVKVHGRSVSVVGYTYKGAYDHLLGHLEQKQSKRWCSIQCMTRTMSVKATAENVRDMRKRIRGLFNKLLADGLFLVVEYGGSRGEITAVKLYEKGNGAEQQTAIDQLTRLRKLWRLSEEKVAQIEALLGSNTDG